MESSVSFLVAILASAFAIITAAPLSENLGDFVPHLVGGDEVSILDREYYVSFRSYKAPVWDKFTTCGGVRLNGNWILTVADCFDSDKFTNTRISFAYNHFVLSTTYRNLTNVKVIRHPNFDRKTNAHNIVLVNSTDFDNNWSQKRFHPTLPSKSETYESCINKSAVITSYNITLNRVERYEIIKANSITVKIEDSKVCDGWYDSTRPKDHQICTLPALGKGLDKNDLGSPLVIPNLKSGKLIGLALKVREFSKEKQPVVFAKIAPYLPWINKVTGIQLLY